jgi:hypothetical protein
MVHCTELLYNIRVPLLHACRGGGIAAVQLDLLLELEE